jgi:hypothetical protein
MRWLVTLAPKVRHVLCRPFGPLGFGDDEVAALTDGALTAGPSDLSHPGD